MEPSADLVSAAKTFRAFGAAAFLWLRPVLAAAHNVDSNDDAVFAAPGRLSRFNYANDFFTGTDRYYTQGIGLVLFDPALRLSPLMRVLPALPGGENFYGLSARHSGFTPTRLDSDAALIGDRPFAATLFLGHVLVSRDPGRRLTLTAELDAGVLGQGAVGKWMQRSIHRALRNLKPLGWDNQIRNDVVLDYYLRLEKGVAAARAADAGVFADATVGTLYTNAGAGVMGRVGAIGEDRKRRWFLFGRAEEKAVGYDATLQGGLFNRHSPYTLTSPQIKRAVARADIGVALDFGSFALEATRTFLSREFTTELSHQWVEISFIRRF